MYNFLVLVDTNDRCSQKNENKLTAQEIFIDKEEKIIHIILGVENLWNDSSWCSVQNKNGNILK